jgi:xanthine dehydrogenase FAD-binding subunit
MDVMFPRTEQELQVMMNANPKARIMAGGTDILVAIRKNPALQPDALICTERVEGWKALEIRGDKLFVGPAVTIQGLLDSDIISNRLPILHQALAALAAPPVRHAATLAGNVCTASPAGDALPPLYALEAMIRARGAAGERAIPMDEWMTGPGKTSLKADEYVAGIEIRLPAGTVRGGCIKVGHRRAMAIAVASLAFLIETDGRSVSKARFAWGSVGPTVLRLPKVEQIVEEGGLTLENLKTAAQMASKLVRPIGDLRATAEYRRRVAGNLLLNLANLASRTGR